MDSLSVLAMNADSIKYGKGWYLILVECKVLTIKEKGFEWMDGWKDGWSWVSRIGFVDEFSCFFEPITGKNSATNNKGKNLN